MKEFFKRNGKICMGLLFALICTLAVVVSVTPFSVVRAEGIGSVTEGSVRIQILSENVIRLEVAESDGFCDKDTFQVVGRGAFTGADYKSVVKNNMRAITVGNYEIFVKQNATSLTGAYVNDVRTGETVWRFFGITNSGELPTPANTPDVFAFNDNPRIVVPETGYSYVGSSDCNSGFEITEYVTDVYLLMADKDAKQLRSDYVKLTGRTSMMPLSAFGLWDSSYTKYDEAMAKSIIEEYASYNFQLDNFVLDTDWNDSRGESPSADHSFGCYGTGYGVDTTLFPDMKAFIAWCHDKNLNVMFNDHPRPTDGTASALSPEELKYREEGLRSLLEMGLDVWWYDRNWYTGLVSPASGIRKETIGQYIYTDVTQRYFNEIAAANGDEYARRALIMSNLNSVVNVQGTYEGIQDVATHRYPFQWTGDIKCSPFSLGQEVDTMLRASMNSVPYTASDLGGFSGSPSTDQYIRWMQYGALSPIYRTHSNGGARRPWSFGQEAVNVVGNYVSMRYRLLPLYYALSHENYETGMPLIRSLEFEYPQYEQSKATDQYILGENILVAPISNYGKVVSEKDFKNLKISFFDNKEMSGAPYYTGEVADVNFDWGTGAPVAGHNENDFSAIIEGTIIPTENCTYSIMSDDGVRVYIDGVRVVDHWAASDSESTPFGMEFVAGKSYKLRIEYYEGSGDARLIMSYDNTGKRTVFIPDGEWIDVWTGITYTGPTTIAVQHTSRTSPIFVKAGSVTALAEDMLNTNDKDWSNLALDWYPSVKSGSVSTLYEDDTKTLAYQDGQFRTTEYGTSYNKENNSVELYINPANGSFKGERAFEERTWRVRIHAPNGWGAPTSVILNGKAVDVEKFTRDRFASPFEYTGATTDNDVYEFTFTAKISDASKVSVKFASYETQNRENDLLVEAFGLKTVVTDRNMAIDLTSEMYDDYAYYTHTGNWNDNEYIEKRKPGVENSGIESLKWEGGVLRPVNDTIPARWHGESGFSQKTIYSDNAVFTQKVTVSGKGKINVYAGGYKSMMELSVLDSKGNGKSASAGNLDTNYYAMFVIEYDTDEPETYTISTRKTNGANYLYSGVSIQKDRDLDFGFSVSREQLNAVTDLTGIGNQDWYHFNNGSGEKASARKNLPEDQRLIKEVTASADSNLGAFWDYKSALVYSDGIQDGKEVNRVSYWSAAINGGNMKVSVNINDKTEYVKLYLSSWRNVAKITVRDGDKVIYSDTPFYMPSNAATGAGLCFALNVSVPEGKTKTLEITLERGLDNGGTNVALAAVAVGYESEEKQNACMTTAVSDGREVDLTAEGTADWFYFDGNAVGKSGADNFACFMGSDIIGSSGATDVPAVKWSDGDKEGSETAENKTGKATCKNGMGATVSVKGGTGYSMKLYLGAWQSTAILTVTAENGKVLGETRFTAADTVFKTVEFRFMSSKDQTLRITLVCTDRTNGNGVVMMYAGTLAETDQVDHEFEITSSTAPTCTEDGYATKSCVYCGYEVREMTQEAIGHSYSKTTVNPTCQKEGKITYTCKNCGDRYEEILPKIDHIYMTDTVEPTCTEKGYTRYTCSICKESYTADEKEATGHNFVGEFDCVDKTCDKCGEILPATKQHDNSEKVVAPTCKDRGYTEYTCKVCGNVTLGNYTDTVDHTFADSATCHDRTCTVCGETVKATTEHVWDDGKVTKPATTDQEGEKTFTCTACGETKTETLEKIGKEESGCASCATISDSADGGIGGLLTLIVTFGVCSVLMFVRKRNLSK